MKTQFWKRSTAWILTVMMILPLISVPTFAEEAPAPIFTQNFETVENDDVFNAIVSQSGGRNNTSISIKDVGGDHGKVYYYDYTNGVEKAYQNYPEETLFLVENRNAAPYPVTEYTVNEDGTYSGSMPLENYYNWETNSYVDAEVRFSNVPLNTTALTSDQEFLVYVLDNGDLIVDENGYPILDADGNPTYEQVYRQLDYFGYYYLVTGQVLNAQKGSGNVAVPSRVKGETITGTEFVFSADYYISADWFGSMDIRLYDTQSFEFAQISTPAGSANNVKITLHPDTATKGYTEGVTVAKDQWFNLSVYANGANGLLEVYVNGQLAGSGVDSAFTCIPLSCDTISRGWNIGHTIRGKNALTGYSGYYMVDNLAIYEGKNGIPSQSEIEAAPDYIHHMNFDTTAILDGFGTGRDYDYDHTSTGGAFRINSDTYDEATATDKENISLVIDKNLYQNTNAPAISADEDGDTVVMEADFFLVPGMTVKMDGQLKTLTADGTTAPLASDPTQTPSTTSYSYSWIQLYNIQSNENGASLIFYATDPNLVAYNTVLPTGAWFTLSTVLDLLTGETSIYVDGVLAASFTLWRNSYYLSNITIRENNGYIAAKLNKMAGGSTGLTTGHSAAYPNGYTDYVLVDNYEVYKDMRLMKAKDLQSVSYDFEDRTYNIGSLATSAVGKGTLAGPSTATYAYAPDGDLSLKLDLSAVESGTTTVPYFGGLNVRGYFVPVERPADEVLGGDPTVKDPSCEDIFGTGEDEAGWTSLEAEESVSLQDPGYTLSQLTRTGSGISGNGDKPIYYARVGTTVYAYQAPASDNYLANEDGSNLVYQGAFQTVPETEEGSGVYSLKYLEYFQGGANVDKYFTVRTPEYKYNAEAGANNSYTFSASYYVAKDAYGYVESQFRTGWTDLFVLDLAKKVMRKRPDVTDPNFVGSVTEISGAVTGTLKTDAWNTVAVNVTLGESESVISVYLNGEYAHSHVHPYSSVKANDWIVAKVAKLANIKVTNAYNGSIYIDDVSTATSSDHIWDNGTITKLPSCSENGEITYTCSCGESRIETIPATGEHIWDDGTIPEGPTCGEMFDMLYTCICEGCGATYTEEHLPTGEHTWDNGYVTVSPTYTEAGEIVYTCIGCGTMREEVLPPVTCSHVFVSTDSSYENGYMVHTHVCSDCSYSETLRISQDECYVEFVPTHQNDGTLLYTCSDCATDLSVTVPALDGECTFGEWHRYDGESHIRYCACGETEIVNHNWNNGTITQEPTNTEAGLMTYVCTDCSEIREEILPPMGGILTLESATAPHGSTVSVDVAIEDNPGLSAIVFTVKYDTTKMTLTNISNSGLFSKITTSTNILLMNDTDVTADGTLVTLTFEVPAGTEIGDYTVEVIFREASNAALQPTQLRSSTGTLTLEHTWDRGKETLEPTCVDEGVMTYTCKACDEKREESIEPYGHEYVSISNVYRDGYLVHVHGCEYCELSDYEQSVFEFYAQDCIEYVAPTCTSEGYVSHNCEICGNIGPAAIPMLPHVYDFTSLSYDAETFELVHKHACVCCTGEWEIRKSAAECADYKAPTYNAEGAATYTCSDCNVTHQIILPKLPITESTPLIMIDSITGAVGSTVDVTVSIKNNPGLSAIVFTVRYDESAMKLISVKNGTVFTDITTGTNVLLMSVNDTTEDGVLVTLTFEIFENTVDGLYTVEPLIRETSNANLGSPMLAWVAGTVEAVSCWGDVNGDKQVTLADAVLLNQYFASYDYDTQSSTVTIKMPTSDVNGDGTVTLADAVLLNQYFASYDYDTGSSSVVLGPKN